MFGTQYAAVLLSEPTVSLVTGYVFMPVFYKLQLYSAFEVLLITYFFYKFYSLNMCA